MNAMMFLPTKYDSLSAMQKRRAELLRDAATEGHSFTRGSQELGMLIAALNKAIAQRINEGTSYNKRPVKQYSEEGKTAAERTKESYKTPEQRKKEKSEESIAIRMDMKGGGGKKK